MLKLIPVIEIFPHSYTKVEIEFPSKSLEEDPESWNEYWKNCQKGTPLELLKPLGNSWFVPLNDIIELNNGNNYKVIKRIVEVNFRSIGKDLQLDHISSLEGGYVLQHNDDNIIFPGCCGDLSNIYDWERCLELEGSEWNEIWIGHPTISVKVENDNLLLSKPHEPSEKANNIALNTNKEELALAIKDAKINITKFQPYLMEVLKEYFEENKTSEVVKIMIYGEYR